MPGNTSALNAGEDRCPDTDKCVDGHRGAQSSQQTNAGEGTRVAQETAQGSTQHGQEDRSEAGLNRQANDKNRGRAAEAAGTVRQPQEEAAQADRRSRGDQEAACRIHQGEREHGHEQQVDAGESGRGKKPRGERELNLRRAVATKRMMGSYVDATPEQIKSWTEEADLLEKEIFCKKRRIQDAAERKGQRRSRCENGGRRGLEACRRDGGETATTL